MRLLASEICYTDCEILLPVRGHLVQFLPVRWYKKVGNHWPNLGPIEYGSDCQSQGRIQL